MRHDPGGGGQGRRHHGPARRAGHPRRRRPWTRKTEEELIAKLDRLEEIWLALKRIEEELRRARTE